MRVIQKDLCLAVLVAVGLLYAASGSTADRVSQQGSEPPVCRCWSRAILEADVLNALTGDSQLSCGLGDVDAMLHVSNDMVDIFVEANQILAEETHICLIRQLGDRTSLRLELNLTEEEATACLTDPQELCNIVFPDRNGLTGSWNKTSP